MTTKRALPSEEPQQSSSSEEEEEEEEEEEDEEEDSSEEEEPHIENQQRSSTTHSKKPQQESSDSGSESDTGSDSEPDNIKVKPVASKPMDGPKPSLSKPSAVVTPSTTRATKRAKKDFDDAVLAEKSVDTAKKQLFQRLFSEDDEIALLTRMIEFAGKKGKDPVLSIDEFHEFIKRSIHIDVTRVQLMDKIRRLKKKFENNVGKAKKGKERTFSNAHEQKTYDLSKNIWGKDRTSGDAPAVFDGSVKTNGTVAKDKKNVETEGERNARMESRAGQLMMRIGENLRSGEGLEGYVLSKGLDLVDGKKKAELEKKWSNLQLLELELFARRAELISEQAKLVLEAYKSMNT